jgi:hypothetical protein
MGSAVGDWVIAGPVDVRQKYRIYTILGEEKKTEQISVLFFLFFFLKE